MQMAEFNLQYALSIPELKAQAEALAPSGTTTGLPDAQLNAIRALVLHAASGDVRAVRGE